MSGKIMQSSGAPKPPEFTDQHVAKYLNRGFEAFLKRDFKTADDCTKLILKYKPELPEAHFLVGLIAIEMDEWAVARKAFIAVVHFKDDHPAAWAQLAKTHVRMGYYNHAEKALEKAVEYGADDPLVHDVIGSVYNLMGDQVNALKYFEKACENTNDPAFEINNARALLYLGKFEEARSVLEKVFKLSPYNSGAHFVLSGIGKAENLDHINEMQDLLKKLKPDSPPTESLYFALGKEYEDLEMWDEAFNAIEHGGKVRRSHVSYDEAEEEKVFEALKETFTKEWLEQVGEGCLDVSPIFIIGQPRTGTTLTERILTARDDVHSAGELPQFRMNLKRMTDTAQSKQLTADTVYASTKLDVKEIGEAYMESTRSLRSNLPRFVDKLPTNYLYAPLIAAALPNAKIIHVTRDAMDSCFSSYKQLFAEAYFHSYDQGEMARHHVRYRRLMDHYREVLGDRMIEVAYEDVVADMETQARRMVDYLGLDWQDASLEFYKQKTAVTTASAAQVREKAHSRSVGKWKRFEEELAPMKNILLDAGVWS